MNTAIVVVIALTPFIVYLAAKVSVIFVIVSSLILKNINSIA
jgi:hypothetical protein